VHHEVDLIDTNSGMGLYSLVLESTSGLIHVDIYAYKKTGGYYIFPIHSGNDVFNNSGKWLLIPSLLMAPLEIKLSSQEGSWCSEGLSNLCKYLYGERWDVPMRKNIDYTVEVVDGVPVFGKPNLMQRIRGWVWLQYSNLYWRIRERVK